MPRTSDQSTDKKPNRFQSVVAVTTENIGPYFCGVTRYLNAKDANGNPIAVRKVILDKDQFKKQKVSVPDFVKLKALNEETGAFDYPFLFLKVLSNSAMLREELDFLKNQVAVIRDTINNIMIQIMDQVLVQSEFCKLYGIPPDRYRSVATLLTDKYECVMKNEDL